MEAKRRISIADELASINQEELFQIIGAYVKSHYEQNNGDLGTWGKIVNYQVHLQDKVYLFDIKGNHLENAASVIENYATMSLKYEDITMIIQNPAIPEIDRFLQEIQDKIEILEQKNNLTPEEREELRALKSTYTTRAFFRLGEIMVKEPRNPIHLVITNPYHFAVALHFTSENIPICIAKGADLDALIIMKMALEANIKVVECRMAARTIYATEELYEPLFNTMMHFLGKPPKDISLYEAIELAKNSDQLVSMEYVIKSMEEKNWEE